MLISLRTTEGETVWVNPDSIVKAKLYPTSAPESSGLVGITLPDYDVVSVYAEEFAKVLDWFEATTALQANRGRLVSDLREVLA